MVCSLVTDRQTHRQTDTQTDKKAKTEAALSGLSEFLTSAHHQGAVQQLLSKTTLTINISSQELRCKAHIHMQSLINVELFVTIPISVMIITMTKYIDLIMHCTSINTFETFVHQDETHDVMIID